MKSLLIACASLAAAAAAGGCWGDGGGGPATPFDPFGTEPAGGTATEPASGAGDTPPAGGNIDQLCARACSRIESICPAASGGATCASDCATGEMLFPGCEAEFRAFISCVASSPLACEQDSLVVPACDNTSLALSNCGSGQPTGGGTAPPRQ